MAPNSSPVFGILQPNNGTATRLWFKPMARTPKSPPSPEFQKLRETLATNLRAFMVVKFGSAMAETTMAIKLGEQSGAGKNTVIRALRPHDTISDLRLDSLFKIATELGAEVVDLLRDHTKPVKRAGGVRRSAKAQPSQAVKGQLQRRAG